MWGYTASPRAFPGKSHCWKTQGADRKKPVSRSALVLIHTAALTTCSQPDEAPTQGRDWLGAVFQLVFILHWRGMETSSSPAVRTVKDRRRMTELDKVRTSKTGIQNRESCILSIFRGWCSVLLYRAQKWVADGQMSQSCQATSGCPIEWHRAGWVFTSQGSRTMLVETAQLIPPKCPLNMIPKPKHSCRWCKKCLVPCYISNRDTNRDLGLLLE